MSDHEGKGAAVPIGARMRGAFGKVRHHGAVSLRGVGRSVAEATDSMGDIGHSASEGGDE